MSYAAAFAGAGGGLLGLFQRFHQPLRHGPERLDRNHPDGHPRGTGNPDRSGARGGIIVFLKNFISAYTQRWLLILGTRSISSPFSMPRRGWSTSSRSGSGRGASRPRRRPRVRIRPARPGTDNGREGEERDAEAMSPRGSGRRNPPGGKGFDTVMGSTQKGGGDGQGPVPAPGGPDRRVRRAAGRRRRKSDDRDRGRGAS